MADRYLTPEEAAPLYGVSSRTVRRWVASRLILGCYAGPRRVLRVIVSDDESEVIPSGEVQGQEEGRERLREAS